MDSPRARRSGVGWLQDVGRRMRIGWLAKMTGTMVAIVAFFVAYFWVLRHPEFPITVMPLTVVDRAVGFLPEMLPLYLSLWVYVSLAPALLIDRRELLSFALAAVALSAVGLGIFFFWPTAVPRPEVDWSRHPAFGFLKSVDASGNACPSLHVAFAVFAGLWLGRLLRRMGAGPAARGLNWLWCAGIVYSTIATRQHVALDVAAGAMLGAMVAAVNFGCLRMFTIAPEAESRGPRDP